MRRERRRGAAWHAVPASECVVAGKPDTSEDTPAHRISSPAATERVHRPGIPAGSIVARHFFGISAVTMEKVA